MYQPNAIRAFKNILYTFWMRQNMQTFNSTWVRRDELWAKNLLRERGTKRGKERERSTATGTCSKSNLLFNIQLATSFAIAFTIFYLCSKKQKGKIRKYCRLEAEREVFFSCIYIQPEKENNVWNQGWSYYYLVFNPTILHFNIYVLFETSNTLCMLSKVRYCIDGKFIMQKELSS